MLHKRIKSSLEPIEERGQEAVSSLRQRFRRTHLRVGQVIAPREEDVRPRETRLQRQPVLLTKQPRLCLILLEGMERDFPLLGIVPALPTVRLRVEENPLAPAIPRQLRL